MLHSLYLFKNVKITPDYSVVHDLSPEDWRTYLIGDSETSGQGDLVWQGDVNYYRLPDVIRIEGNYDDLRKATYGMISGNEEADPEEMVIHNSMQRPMFFWVTDVRLVKQGCRVDLESQSRPWQKDYFDVVELSISIDVWSSNNGSFDLYDSYVERRHMNRWQNTGTEAEPVWEPIYYPNAAQGITGVYKEEASQDLTPYITRNVDPFGELRVDPKYILVTCIPKYTGTAKILLGIETISSWTEHPDSPPTPISVYHEYNTKRFFGLKDVLDGSLFSAAGITAEFVQSIIVFPYIDGLYSALRLNLTGTPYVYLDETQAFFNNISIADANGLAWMVCEGDPKDLQTMMQKLTARPTIVEPDHEYAGEDPDDPDTTVYYDEHEPMMYYSPARQRKIVSGMGGNVTDIPDVDAFQEKYTLQNVIDLNSAITLVFGGDDIKRANAIGNMGVVEAATLPIFNSAWKSYEAISKVSDTIMYNAKQMQTIGGGATSTAIGGIGGMTQGGPLGAIAGIISGVVGTGLSYYGNDEELRAKQMQIKNSPAVVKSGGSGLGAYILNYIDIWYMTLKMDDQSMEKLRFMYYWFGYHVNRTFKGVIDLHTRTKFDFIKTSGARVKGDLTAGAAKEIGSIFDRGVTIYHGPEGYALIGTGDMVANDEVE